MDAIGRHGLAGREGMKSPQEVGLRKQRGNQMNSMSTDFNTQAAMPWLLLVMVAFWFLISEDADDAQARLSKRRKGFQKRHAVKPLQIGRAHA